MLARHFEEQLTHWNNTYSFTPLSIELSLPPKGYHADYGLIIHAHDVPVASIDKEYLPLVNHSLFGIHDDCFNPSGEELFQVLIKQFLKKEHCAVSTHECSIQEWFYRGSTALILTLSCNTNKVTMALHPDWVYQNLLPSQNNKKNRESLDEAVAQQPLSFTLLLNTLTLPLNQLMALKKGDVIATDHLISEPLKVTQHEHFIAHAELGQSSLYKSIVLKR